MLMTEQEAKTKICCGPLHVPTGSFTHCRGPACAGWQWADPETERIPGGAHAPGCRVPMSSPLGKQQVVGGTCSVCDSQIFRIEPRANRKGFCGLAGTAEF